MHSLSVANTLAHSHTQLYTDHYRRCPQANAANMSWGAETVLSDIFLLQFLRRFRKIYLPYFCFWSPDGGYHHKPLFVRRWIYDADVWIMYVNNVCHPCYMLYNLRRAIKLYYCCVATVHKISQSYAVTQSPNSRLWGTIFFNLRWLRWKFSKTSRLSSANTHIYARTRTHAHRGALTQEYVPNEYRTENAWFLWKT